MKRKAFTVLLVSAVLAFIFSQTFIAGQDKASRPDKQTQYSVVTRVGGVGTEYQLMYQSTGTDAPHHFLSVYTQNDGVVYICPYPGEANQRQTSWFVRPFLQGYGYPFSWPFSHIIQQAKVPKPVVGEKGVKVTILGDVLAKTKKRFGNFTISLVFSYDATEMKVSGTGTYTVRLIKPLNRLRCSDWDPPYYHSEGHDGLLSADLSLGEIKTNYLHDVPLSGGGIGDTGDMSRCDVVTDSSSYTWDPIIDPLPYQHETTKELGIIVSGQYNQWDPFALAQKPTVKVNFASRTEGLPFVFGADWDPYLSRDDWRAINMFIAPIIFRTAADKKYVFDVTFEATIPASAGTHTITATAGPGGSISPSGLAEVPDGGGQLFTITPDDGFWPYPSEVLVDGVSAIGSVNLHYYSDGEPPTYHFNHVKGDHTISVTFTAITPATHTILATAGPNGSISPSGLVTVPYRGDQSFTITFDDNFQLGSLQVDGVSVEGLPSLHYMDKNMRVAIYDFADVTGNHTISATFTVIPVMHIITTTAGPNGYISPGGLVSVPDGGDQLFTITPDRNYRIVDVLVDGSLVGEVTTYKFANVTGDHTISATFTAIPVVTHTITATAGPGGSISPSGLVEVPDGDSPWFTVTPDDGFRPDLFYFDGVPYLSFGSGSIGFTNVREDHTLFVTFSIGVGAPTH